MIRCSRHIGAGLSSGPTNMFKTVVVLRVVILHGPKVRTVDILHGPKARSYIDPKFAPREHPNRLASQIQKAGVVNWLLV